MSPESLVAFAGLALLAIATPGPAVLLALTNGSRHGVRASVPGMVGAVLSDLFLMAAVALGLGALLAGSVFLFSVVKWLGVAYLAYLGFCLLRSKGTLAIETGGPGREPCSPRRLFTRSFLLAVTNPKGYLFFSALLPQFIEPTQPQLPQYAALAFTFAGLDFLVMMAYASAGARAIRWLKVEGMRWLERLCGGALLALAGSLALYRRNA